MTQQPFWVLLPHINNRTAWKPISFPAILIIPSAAVDNKPLAKSGPIQVNISILNVVRRNKVSGHQNPDVFFPDTELYTTTISGQELAQRLIDISDFENDGTTLTIIDKNGVEGQLPYDPAYLYYNFSDVETSVENLEVGRYQLNYQAILNKRVYDSQGSLICIDDTEQASIILNVEINHPGEILNEMVKTTPSIWFSSSDLGQDPLMTLYKPLSDSLQNVFDEQILLSRLNFISKATPETIQLLGQTIGWEIPYFPKSLDPLRKSILRLTTQFQKNKSSFNSIHQLFDVFGYNILIRNLWYNQDYTELLEPSYSPDAPVKQTDEYVLDVVVGDLIAPGFYSSEVPLTKKPSTKTEYENFYTIGSDVYIEAYAVKIGSDAHLAIQDFIAEGDYGDISKVTDGVINNDLNSRLAGLEVYASHQVEILGDKIQDVYKTGPRDLLFTPGIKFDKYKPTVQVNLDGYWDDPEIAIFTFAIYKSQTIDISQPYENSRSNYFDIRLNSRGDTLQPTSLVLDYVLEFLYRIKAFHSLLRTIYLESHHSDVYLVTDYCYGPGLSISSDSDAGQQQVPLAIVPLELNSVCEEQDPLVLGYKSSDIIYRNRVTAGLIEEWSAYLEYDLRTKLGGILKMAAQEPDITRLIGLYNRDNQDAFLGTYEQSSAFGVEQPFELANQHLFNKLVNIYKYSDSPIDDRDTSFRKNGQVIFDGAYQGITSLSDREPMCFKGRVSDNLFINLTARNDETINLAPCENHMGNGSLFLTPRISIIVREGAKNRTIGSKTPKPIISSNLPESGIEFKDQAQGPVGISPSRISAGTSSVVHYWDRPTEVDVTWDSALSKKVNLGIQRTNMHFPGTKFIEIGKYNGTFGSSEYKPRPWDFGPCEDPLNTRIVTGENGNQYLVFDEVDFTFTNNNGEPDLPLLGQPTQSPINEFDVVHSIYSRYADEDSVGLCPFDTSVDENGQIVVENAVFKSAAKCGTGDTLDIADGYPCKVGIFTYNEIIDTGGTEVTPTEFLFLLSSGIKDGSFGVRLDCGCTTIECAPESSYPCGTREVDALEIDIYLDSYETCGVSSFIMNGEIESMFELQY